MFQHQDEFKHNRGFTLVEVMIALMVLTIGLIPAFQQATSAITLSGSIRNSLIASYLAQEGAEVIRGIRDDNWFSSKPFDTGLSGCSNGCVVQYDSTSPALVFAFTPLRLDPTTGLYQYSAGNPTPFTRSIIITQVSAHELKVISEVAWDERGVNKTFQVEEHLFDWLQ